MNKLSKRTAALVLIFSGFFAGPARAQDLNLVGLTLLQTVTTNLNGTGIRVAQVEATETLGATNFEANPFTIGVASNLFTYISGAGTATNFPNTVGGESTHALQVAGNFYGPAFGLSTNVAHVDNYFADFFVQVSEFTTPLFTNYTVSLPASNINDPVANQSFVFGTIPVNLQQAVDSAYDNYAAQFATLFVSGAGNGAAASGNNGFVEAPSTCYNGISVAAYNSTSGSSSIGPTIDNGRAKPDITAPAAGTSFSTPQVAGAAAVLIQAGLRGDGGSDTNSVADIRTVKALLLNGAVKPADWTNIFPYPLDVRYGAGVLNIFNSYEQLAGGKHDYIVSTSVATNSPHLPTGATGTIGALSGWDFNTNSSSATTDCVNHYYFNVTNNLSGATFTATATLVWNRHRNKTGINNLDLFLYDAVSSNLVACSTSLVDNVEHIFVPQLAQGRYDLQVLKKGGTTVTASESYALAWEFFSMPLSVAQAGTNVAFSWPVYPAGFFVEATTNLTPPIIWETNDIPASVVTGNQNYILLNGTNAVQFFRLHRP